MQLVYCSGSKKMRTGTGLNRFLILGTGTGTNHIGSGFETDGSKAGTRFRCSPLLVYTQIHNES